MDKENQTIRVGLLGLGTVGTGVVRIIEGHQEDLKRRIGASVDIVKICVQNLDKERAIAIDRGKLTTDADEVINDPNIDLVIEVMGGVEQTREHLLRALVNGKHVVTANKDLMALHGQEILKVAAENECDVLYEASVAGGIPIIRTLIEGFASDRIQKMMGIVNGTTNYILTKMSQEGASYETVLQEAQNLGYAEADPTSDVGGFDAAYKMIILSTLGFHTPLEFADVEVKGITSVTAEDIHYGKQLGYEVKLLGIAERQDGLISVSVEPTMVKKTHPLAAVNGVFNAVYVYGEAVGETMFYGPGAGELPTATSVVSDVVAVARNMLSGVNGHTRLLPYNDKQLKTDEQISNKYFLRLQVADRAGVLASITQVFAEHEVSLESVLQQPKTNVLAQITQVFADNDVSLEAVHQNGGQVGAEIIIITHDASKAAMNKVLQLFARMDVILNVKSVYRVEG